MTRAVRIEIIQRARQFAREGKHDEARRMFALVGISYAHAEAASRG